MTEVINKPNVIVFFTDQQRWDTTGLHGNPMGLTPNLDRLGREHTHAAHSFTCQPVCGPARSCLQTGLYATTTGCHRNAIPLPADSRTMAHYFADAGYQTGYIGKWHLHDSDVKGAVPASARFGYQYWLASNVLEFTSDAYDTVLYDNDEGEVRLPGYRVDAVTDAAIRYVDTHRDDPFFLFISYIEPHHQNHLDDYPPPDGYRETYTGGWVPPDLAALSGSTMRSKVWRWTATLLYCSPRTTVATLKPAMANTSAPATRVRFACQLFLADPAFAAAASCNSSSA